MNRREFLKALGLSTLFPSCVMNTPKPPTKPNIIFLIVDDMGWADLGCYGSKAIHTPHLDRMANEGMLFTQAYSGCTVCAPARSTLMTGHHMGHTSIRSNSGGAPLVQGDFAFPMALKKAGYATGGFGKWGLGDIGTTGAAELFGFDAFFGYYHQIHAHYYYPEYLIHNGKKYFLEGNKGFYDKKRKPGPVAEKGRQFTQELIFERMKAFIKKNRKGPFFCYGPWTPPHARYELPEAEPAYELYKDKPWPMDAKIHAAFCTMVDRQAGELLDLLKELGIDQETVVFFCSDNGASKRFEGTLDSSGPLRGYKRSMYEGGIRVPMIVRWPGRIPEGAKSDHACYFPDVAPTLAQMAGAEKHLPGDLDGISFCPTLFNKPLAQKKHQVLYWEWTPYSWGAKRGLVHENTMQAVRMGQYKGVRYGFKNKIELYDLANDLGEKKDLAEKFPHKIAEIEALFKSMRTPPRDQPEPKMPKGKSYR